MSGTPRIIDLVHDCLKESLALATIKEWHKANSLVTLNSPGCSIGIEKENFEPYTREQDEVTASMNLLLWVKNIDPVKGEAEVRELAQAARFILTNNRTLGGEVDDSYVNGIQYATADGGKSVLLHLAEIDFQVIYYADRLMEDDLPTVQTINNDVNTD